MFAKQIKIYNTHCTLKQIYIKAINLFLKIKKLHAFMFNVGKYQPIYNSFRANAKKADDAHYRNIKLLYQQVCIHFINF